MERKNYISFQGLNVLRRELRELQEVERPRIVDVVSWAASNGDRSENGDYIYGKKRLREIDRRIRYLIKSLESAVLVDFRKVKRDDDSRIFFGATVWFVRASEKAEKIVILGKDEVDSSKGHVSWISPIAQVLLGKKAGDDVLFQAPSGEVMLNIIRVSYDTVL